ncbi:MAG: DUF3788 domain-containing protein [Ruminococcaceae bacterium]|nr:DUF3788 domain-containing protein [Oscillospiraceae bacterium]
MNDEFDRAALLGLVGEQLAEVWQELCAAIEAEYETDRLWGKGFGCWTYEYKYRRGGKTLCTLYAKENAICLLVTLGRAEREKFDARRESFSAKLQELYDTTETYHDGKWMWIELRDSSLIDELLELLHIKRRPNRK